MKMSQEKLTHLIKKMINVIKPIGVLEIDFRLEPMMIHDNGYYMNITYILPDDSPLMNSSNNELNMKKMNWNTHIKKTIQNYFDVDVIINSTSFSSESFYKQKNRK